MAYDFGIGASMLMVLIDGPSRQKGHFAMAVVISLREVADALEMLEGHDYFLNPQTGEIVMISEDDWSLVEDEDENEDAEDSMPEWQREMLPKLREDIEGVNSGRYLALPDKFDVNDWSIMESFAESRNRQELLEAIHGSGAFRRFRVAVERLGLLDKWYEYRGNALEEIARRWLKENRLEFKEDGRISGRPHEKRISRQG